MPICCARPPSTTTSRSSSSAASATTSAAVRTCPNSWRATTTPDLRLAELRLEDEGVGEVSYPPQGSFRHGATISAWYANVQAGNRPLQELKKISIVEAKGYCYGWHFYQCADADLVISSDDALFGHPSFRYYGWGPRMWTWVQMMGLRKFQEMVFTGRPFTRRGDGPVQLPQQGGAARSARGRGRQVRAGLRAQPSDRHRLHAEGLLRGVSSSTRASTWAACCRRSSSRWASGVASDGHGRPGHDTRPSTAAWPMPVNDNDSKFPPDFRLSKSNRKKKK